MTPGRVGGSAGAGLLPPALVDTMTGRTADPGLPPGTRIDGASWLASLPATVARLLTRWSLRLDPGLGAAWSGHCALVVPVLTQTGRHAALKVTWPHVEAAGEHLALRSWGGHGAVELLAADPSRWALLLERLDAGRDLTGVSLMDASDTIGDLLRRLAVPPSPRFARLSTWAEGLREELVTDPPPVPRRHVEQALATIPALLAEPGGVDGELVHTDLHYENVLATLDPADPRGPWLAIDPKPLAAERAFAVAPLLWNRWDEAVRATNLRAHLRFRLGLVCDAAGIDEDRARAWTLLRELANARDLADSGDRDGLTVAVSIMTAVAS
ncbi:aminoglycoside phosphotransferase family protein [Arsenicicoccus piscis]|uniref:Streptomycin 6-kinase n=1 Tax=Arsenicicoccus piscis TaxID=673954 RepID=A0ABQ6HMC4_9MICO|nr:aminoglycoside phosphotransferase family protein [Arsenicicoccus piscis]MCH8627253.1 aminoglycoside phosphotransferase family protein [Arsenicicoccus piscis]GMA18765.1 streptomycin 6-kinase [Arsenicicoccus piscis]